MFQRGQVRRLDPITVVLLACAVHSNSATVHAQGLGHAYEYQFREIPASGPGTYEKGETQFGGPDRKTQFGGGLEKTHQIEPPPQISTSRQHLEVYSNSTATTFWTSAISPLTPFPIQQGWNVGGEAELVIGWRFRKETEDASLEFTISHLTLGAFGPDNVPRDNEGLFGAVSIEVNAYQASSQTTTCPSIFLDHYSSETTLSGWPTDYDFEPGALDVGVTQGGLGQEVVEIGLQSPFRRVVDLSCIEVGKDFSLTYQMKSKAIDTIQVDTVIEAFGRDPLDPASGVVLTHSGLTLVPVDPDQPPDPIKVILSPAAVLGTNLGEFDPCPGCGVGSPTPMVNMINQSGVDSFESGVMEFDSYINSAKAADANSRNIWQSQLLPGESLPGGQALGYVDFDLGDERIIDRLAIWNGSAKEVEILVGDAPEGPWRPVGDFTLASKVGFHASYFPDVLEFDESVDARYMRIDVNSVYIHDSRFPFPYAEVGEVAVSVASPPVLANLDLDNDGDVDLDDMDLAGPFGVETQEAILAANNTIRGDFDFQLDADGNRGVQFGDFVALSLLFGQEGTRYSQGNFDFSADGTQFDDFLAMAIVFGTTVTASGAVATVPEPSSVLLLGAGALLLGLRRRACRIKTWTPDTRLPTKSSY